VPARLRWALISIGYLVFSYLIATLIPAFSAIQGLIGSLCGSPILFGFPAAFYILACRLNKKKISTFDKVTCALFLCVLCPLFFLCGTIDSIMQIGDAVNQGRRHTLFHLLSIRRGRSRLDLIKRRDSGDAGARESGSASCDSSGKPVTGL